jgi:CopG family nickel-responsive transcriptional regulator
MQRITITIDDDLAQELYALAEARGYQNRSETMRDLVRAGIASTRIDTQPSAECLAAVVYVYDQGTRELPKRLAHSYQENHDLSAGTLRLPLDHDTCLEVAVLKGNTAEVGRFAERIVAERGVRHGRVIIIPAAIERERHAHGEGRPHVHQHIKVR